ncbi:MAG TPA: hypothetical protein VL944_01550 [Candidatus Acidoferrum sp.]|nr:hypothetical protein [Candidatus Acidoferrum sp.]
MEKQIYDSRGRQTSIARLAQFDAEAFIHMLFYRILIIFSILTFAAFVYSYATKLDFAIFQALFLAVWVLFTPQVFETAKGISLIQTRGFVFGRLNKSYTESAKNHVGARLAVMYRVIPYAALLVWVIGFAALLYVWFI